MTATSKAPTILCVDDEASILSSLRRVFLDEPWEMIFAESGQEGLALIEDRDVDLVLSDYRMPGMDGVAFLKHVKEVQPDCMRIVLSGYADIKTIVNALNEGEIYRFIPKPWNDGELLHNIRKALEHHRLGRENRQLNEEMRELNALLEQKVEQRTRELMEKNRALEFAGVILELLPMPVLGVDGRAVVVFANAKARELLETADRPLVGGAAPEAFEPELTGAIERARQSGDRAHRVMPMVLDGEPVGAIILAPEEDTLDLEPCDPRQAFRWSVTPQ